MTNRSDDEFNHELNITANVDNVVATTSTTTTTITTATTSTTDHDRGIQALNERRVQMLELLEAHKTNDNGQWTREEGRYCWVCFATDEDDTMAEWAQPCKCSGTTKWVHQSCLQRWVDEKQKGNAFKRVNCPQCRTEYIIVFPEMGTFVSILEGIDSLIKRLSPFLAAGVIVGSLYWTAVTYGAVTVCIQYLFKSIQ